MSTPDPTVALARSPDELTLLEYQQLANLTDRSAPSRRTNFDFPLLGLFGEVGSLLAEVKKKQRDTDSYAGYEPAVLEELGDTLWYLANLATRAGLSLPELTTYSETPVARPVETADRAFQALQPVFAAPGPRPPDAFEAELLRLAGRVGTLVIEVSGHTAPDRNLIAPLASVLHALIALANSAGVRLGHIRIDHAFEPDGTEGMYERGRRHRGISSKVIVLWFRSAITRPRRCRSSCRKTA
jgi:NTP pyrophosphatase (non-canonical NTP hydrolase)